MGFLAQLGATISIVLSSIFGYFVSNPEPLPVQNTDTAPRAQTHQIPATAQAQPSSFSLPDNTSTKLVPIISSQGSSIGSGVETYYKDSQHVYMAEYGETPSIVPGADPNTFTPDVKTASTTKNYYSAFAQDKNHVFYYGRPTAFDPQGFVLLDAGSGKDCGWSPIARVVHGGRTEFFTITYDASNTPSFTSIEGADPATFEIVANGYSKDKNHVYVGASTTSADPATFNASMAVRCPGGF